MKVLLIVGSIREGSNSGKLAAMASSMLEDRGLSVDLVDPRDTPMAFPGQADHDQHAQALRARAGEASGAIFVTPEYDGSYSAILKLTIEHFGYPSCLAGKPAAMLGCAGGHIGAVKALEHLRGTLSHTGAFVMPFAYSVASVFKVFDQDGKCTEPEVENGVRQTIDAFCDFLQAK